MWPFKKEKKIPYTRYYFEPQDDITTQELAIIVKYKGYPSAKIATLPANVLRHFRTEVIEINESDLKYYNWRISLD